MMNNVPDAISNEVVKLLTINDIDLSEPEDQVDLTSDTDQSEAPEIVSDKDSQTEKQKDCQRSHHSQCYTVSKTGHDYVVTSRSAEPYVKRGLTTTPYIITT
ncbi:hypothetical protein YASMINEVIRUS_539 [Yasminevirus sp. GU-2018]|uniref:Uncharacterized protein n=1 Tax=Yasminevirus sp. GU-2018 TaxID=2420051 RepID=A0A5K0UAF6_9VIRU|nr:hypothetical protein YASMINEVIRUS_539 [Yasminevirus sp. GU-2018]